MTFERAESERPDDEEIDPAELNTEIFKCPYCEADFDTEADLVFHRTQVHLVKAAIESYACPVCDMEFPTKEQLNTHGQFDHPAP